RGRPQGPRGEWRPEGDRLKSAAEADPRGGRGQGRVRPSAFVCRDKSTSVHDDKPAVRHVGVRPALAKSLTSRELGCCRSRLLSQHSSGSVLFTRGALIRSLSCRFSCGYLGRALKWV